MKGFYTNYSYHGWIPWLGRYMVFATEGEYEEYYREMVD